MSETSWIMTIVLRCGARPIQSWNELCELPQQGSWFQSSIRCCIAAIRENYVLIRQAEDYEKKNITADYLSCRFRLISGAAFAEDKPGEDQGTDSASFLLKKSLLKFTRCR